tara:strand:+ start:18 stop:242 length:225 start_codon:yes stop_codon:yes gene_type:complete
MEKNLWWGYIHTSGTVHAKRYFSEQDIIEANQSPFCDLVSGPWLATDREEALSMLKLMGMNKLERKLKKQQNDI